MPHSSLSPDAAQPGRASEHFDHLCAAQTLRSIVAHHRRLCAALELRPARFPDFYPKLKVRAATGQVRLEAGWAARGGDGWFRDSGEMGAGDEQSWEQEIEGVGSRRLTSWEQEIEGAEQEIDGAGSWRWTVAQGLWRSWEQEIDELGARDRRMRGGRTKLGSEQLEPRAV